LHFVNTLASVNDLDLRRLLTFKLPGLTSIFHCIRRSKGFAEVSGFVIHFVAR
jgi:hypothetical protein